MGGSKIDFKTMVYRIRGFYFVNRRMPTYSELTKLLGYSSKGAVRYAINKLIDEGYLEKDGKGNLLPNKISDGYPLLGSIQAGFPSPAEEQLLDTVSFDNYLVGRPEATYLVSVSGDSMIEAGILPGDMVIVERNSSASDGDIVVAQVDGDWTLKFLEKKSGRVRLLPANAKYKPIEPTRELNIGGIVKGVVRKY